MTLERPVNILVVGGGGREHALCWKLASSPLAAAVFCAPGNGGTATTAGVTNVDISPLDFRALAEFCKDRSIELVVVGPDNPLAEGLVDELEAEGLRVFGPRKESARLEWSKAYAKQVMTEHGIPTARYAVCDSLEVGREIIRDNPWARIVKVDGLALGKGAFVCDSAAEAEAVLSTIFKERTFGAAGSKVVIEERLYGEEISLICLCDGKRLSPLVPSQDFKKRFDADAGPNTGGMGAYAPVPLFADCADVVEERVLAPLRRALESGSLLYKGALYIGLMIVKETSWTDLPGASPGPYKPYVLEFNARFGDPETQAILPLMTSDLLRALWACTEGALDEESIQWSDLHSCCVVAATREYPGGSSRGEPVDIATPDPGQFLFHAGTIIMDGLLFTNGGRILSVTGVGESRKAARDRAYAGIDLVSFDSKDFRRDIAGGTGAPCL